MECLDYKVLYVINLGTEIEIPTEYFGDNAIFLDK
jgi:hypothetical protein